MELLALRETNQPQTVADHVADCLRCTARLRDLPALTLGDLPEPPQPTSGLQGAGRTVHAVPDDIRTGQLWTASVDGDAQDREVVVVIGRAPANGMVIVAPTSTTLDQAGDSDLIVDGSPAGYPHLIEVWNHGLLERGQLREYLGRVDRPVREDLVSIYQWLAGTGDQAATQTPVGPPIAARDDERLVQRALRQDRLRPLWAAADQRL